jgi:hypothetical protein
MRTAARPLHPPSAPRSQRDWLTVLALLLLALLLAGSGDARQQVSTEEGSEREWTGTIESVETQSKTLLLRTDEGSRKLLYDEATEILENGERVEVSRLEPGTAVRVDAVKRGFDFVAVQIVIEAEPE